MTRICVLGLGNLLWADEGFGVRLAEQLLPLYQGIDHVKVIDGGTQGLALLPYISDVQCLLILDAIDFAMPAGTLAEFRGGEIPAYLTAKKLSLHQTGFAEVLGMMQLMRQGPAPENMVLIGVQPFCLEDYGGSLSDLVKAQLPAAVDKAIAVMRQWGVEPLTVKTTERINHHSLEMHNYEAQRPDSVSACRIGDARVLQRRRPSCV